MTELVESALQRCIYIFKRYKYLINAWLFVTTNCYKKCIDCVENERVYGPDTEYMIGEYANHKNGLCDIHNEIHVDVAHYNEDYCDFCEEKVG